MAQAEEELTFKDDDDDDDNDDNDDDDDDDNNEPTYIPLKQRVRGGREPC
jgi:hypothetical protein